MTINLRLVNGKENEGKYCTCGLYRPKVPKPLSAKQITPKSKTLMYQFSLNKSVAFIERIKAIFLQTQIFLPSEILANSNVLHPLPVSRDLFSLALASCLPFSSRIHYYHLGFDNLFSVNFSAVIILWVQNFSTREPFNRRRKFLTCFCRQSIRNRIHRSSSIGTGACRHPNPRLWK